MNAHLSPTRAPGVMVSSTFFDLRQLRDDLRRFVEIDLGYRALLSEHPSFPINPQQSSIENCRERVERDADVLVLVIGRRYGSMDSDSAKSVTNLEYLAARQKGIPVFVFADDGLIKLLPVWQRNPDADFSSEVDSPKLFEFLESVRSTDKVWMQEFRRAHDIIDALRIQFAFQHCEGLAAVRRLSGVRHESWLDSLTGAALRIALERPTAWEHRLFATALTDSIGKRDRLKRRHALGIAFGLGEDVREPLKWFQARFQDAVRLTEAFGVLINTELPVAFGAPGEAGDRERILFVVESLGELYEDALRWSAKIRTANVEETFRPPLRPLAKTMDDLIGQIEQFGPAVQAALAPALQAIAEGRTPPAVELTLSITVPETAMEEFQAALSAAARASADERANLERE